MRSGPNAHGFTLIELLVVVTIIVALLALLTPALDLAIYSAELAVCGGNMRGAAGGVLLYAFDHKRFYPARPGVKAAGWTSQMIKLGRSHANSGTGGVWDDRPLLAGYLDINGALGDPLSEPVNLEVDDEMTTIFVSYSIWFNFEWRDGFPPGSKGMSKVGQKITFVNDAFYTPPRRFRLGVLLGDRDISAPPNYANGSHPDADGVMVNYVMDNEPIDRGNQDAAVRALETLNGNVTESNWIVSAAPRGEVDTNHAYDDGSVRRLDRVPYGFGMVFSSYNLWFGWKWDGTERPSRGLLKQGQKMTYETQEPVGGPWVRRSYSVLAGDTLGHWGFAGIWTAHPDHDGAFTQQVHQDEPWGGSNPGEQKSTVSLWYAFGPQVPGNFDQNYVFEDGSVRRYDDVHWNVEPEERERFPRAPNFHKGADVHASGTWQAIPIR